MWLKVTEAKQILPPAADRYAWRMARRTGLGGSDALAVAGLSSRSSPYEVWLDKSGRLPLSRVESMPMRLGNLLEPIVAMMFTEETGLETRMTGTWRHRQHRCMIANPDRFTSDRGILECKTTNSFLGRTDWLDDEIPDAAESQIQHYHAVVGSRRGYAAALIGNERFEVREVPRDEEIIEDLRLIAADFWARVRSGDEPPVDGSPATTAAVKEALARVSRPTTTLPPRAVEIIRDRQRITRQIKAATEQLDALNNELRLMIGDAEYGCIDGTPVASFKKITATRIDPAKLRQLHPAVAVAVSVSTEYRALRLLKAADNLPDPAVVNDRLTPDATTALIDRFTPED